MAEEWRLQQSLEDGQWWRRSDVRRQTVSNASCSDSEGAVTDGDTTRWWNVQLERRSGTKSPSRVHVRHTTQFSCKIWLSYTMQATEGTSWNSIRCGMRNQLRCWSSGVLWSHFLAEHTSRAAAFVTDCSLSSWLLATLKYETKTENCQNIPALCELKQTSTLHWISEELISFLILFLFQRTICTYFADESYQTDTFVRSFISLYYIVFCCNSK